MLASASTLVSKVWKTLRRLALAAAVALPTASGACAPTEGEHIDLHGKTVRLTVIHTSDIHSRIFPYQYTPLLPDRNAGLQLGKGPYGGMARVAHIIRRERARADRSLHIDGGDIFQGAPVFNYYSGEAEIRALAETGVDAMVIANHEFDRGVENVTRQIQKWATFPVLAGNYQLEEPGFQGNSPIGTVLKPYSIHDVRGLRVAVVGMGNLSTITSIFEQPNKLGILPYKTRDIAQFWVDFLRPQSDLIVFVTHLGLEYDEQMIHETEGIDIVLGGHNHIVVAPPKVVYDCGGKDAETGFVEIPNDKGDVEQRACKPRKVLLMHSGAFAKFVGRLDVDVTDDPQKVETANGKPAGFYDPVNGFEVVGEKMQIFPVDADVPEDRRIVALLEPYKQALKDIGNLDLLVGYAPAEVRRTSPAGGDSQLGNLIATAMWLRLGVQTDFALTNTTGIRADLPKGPVTLENMFNVFPFDNSISKMQLSGGEIFELFDFVARRSKLRGCTSQVQIAGAQLIVNCTVCDTHFRPDLIPAGTPPGNFPLLKEACGEQLFIGFTDQACSSDLECVGSAKDCVAGKCGATANACLTNDDCTILARNACDRAVGRCRNPVQKNGSYELATSNYLATGGSGFRVLQRNTTQFDTKIQQRDAASDFIRIGKPCGWQTTATGESGLRTCSTDADCASLGDFVCACPEGVEPAVGPDVEPLVCKSTATCGSAARCVLRDCRDDVAAFHAGTDCSESSGEAKAKCRAEACRQAGEQCKLLACVDATLGAKVDGRQVMLGR